MIGARGSTRGSFTLMGPLDTNVGLVGERGHIGKGVARKSVASLSVLSSVSSTCFGCDDALVGGIW